jgi:hypothetical protein
MERLNTGGVDEKETLCAPAYAQQTVKGEE